MPDNRTIPPSSFRCTGVSTIFFTLVTHAAVWRAVGGCITAWTIPLQELKYLRQFNAWYPARAGLLHIYVANGSLCSGLYSEKTHYICIVLETSAVRLFDVRDLAPVFRTAQLQGGPRAHRRRPRSTSGSASREEDGLRPSTRRQRCKVSLRHCWSVRNDKRQEPCYNKRRVARLTCGMVGTALQLFEAFLSSHPQQSRTPIDRTLFTTQTNIYIYIYVYPAVGVLMNDFDEICIGSKVFR